jgi:hypothetical protein
MQDAKHPDQRWFVQVENAVWEAVQEPAVQAAKDDRTGVGVMTNESQGFLHAKQEVLVEAGT